MIPKKYSNSIAVNLNEVQRELNDKFNSIADAMSFQIVRMYDKKLLNILDSELCPCGHNKITHCVVMFDGKNLKCNQCSCEKFGETNLEYIKRIGNNNAH